MACWTKKQLYDNVDSLLEELDITHQDYPIDSKSLAKKFCINLHIEEIYLNNLCGILYKGKSTGIALNANHTKVMQNFDCMHELIHYFLHEDISSFKCICPEKGVNQCDRLEWQANEGAAQALVPFQLFIPRYVELSQKYPRDCMKIKILKILTKEFNVSENVIENRINNLKYEIYQYFIEKKDIKEIELYSLSRLVKENKKNLTAESLYCSNCRSTVNSEYKFCHICGKKLKFKSFWKGLGFLIYKDGIELDKTGRVKYCPRCNNEIFEKGIYCPICGAKTYNFCEGKNLYDEYDNIIGNESCDITLAGNARYCHECGAKSTFYEQGYLVDWDQYNEAKYTDDDFIPIDGLPFE